MTRGMLHSHTLTELLGARTSCISWKTFLSASETSFHLAASRALSSPNLASGLASLSCERSLSQKSCKEAEHESMPLINSTGMHDFAATTGMSQVRVGSSCRLQMASVGRLMIGTPAGSNVLVLKAAASALTEM